LSHILVFLLPLRVASYSGKKVRLMNHPAAVRGDLALWFAAWLLLCFICLGCGSQTASSAGDSSSTAHDEEASDQSASSEQDDSESASTGSSSARPIARASCAGGVCTECGEGACPPGMFCVSASKGSPGCSWFPQCGRNDDCGCISKHIGNGCRCEKRGNAVQVSCD